MSARKLSRQSLKSRFSDPQLNLSANTVTTSSPTLIIPAIKHTPLPPQLQSHHRVVFELGIFTYLLICLFAQYINVYKAVWWLPHGPSPTSLNFTAIDWSLVTLIGVLLCLRPMLLMFLYLRSPSLYRQLTIVVIVAGLCLALNCLATLRRHNSFLNLLFLFYPIAIYLMMFGPSFVPCLEEFTEPLVLKSRSNDGDIKTVHTCCFMGSEYVRRETEILWSSFYSRVKRILFSSFVSTYYVSFIPLCFTPTASFPFPQSFQSYDFWWSLKQMLFVLLNMFVVNMDQYLNREFIDNLHRVSLHLGSWKQLIHTDSGSYGDQVAWSGVIVWPKNQVVCCGNQLYKALGTHNTAAPANAMHRNFYDLFSRPLRLLNFLTLIQIYTSACLLFCLYYTTLWHQTISISLQLFSSYYIMFRLVRDRLSLGKTYSVKMPE